MSLSSERLGQQALESYLWGAANLLRGLIDAGDYKQYVFPLLFFKRLADVWDEEYHNALDETGDEGYAQATADDRFIIPAGAHWSDVRSVSRGRGPGAAQRVPRHRDGQPGATRQRLRERALDRQGADAGRDPQEPDRALLEAHLEPCRGARRRAGQRLRVPRQAVRRRQRPHGPGVLHQPDAGAPDDPNAPAAAGRAHLRSDGRHRRHAHFRARGGPPQRRAMLGRSASTDRRSSARPRPLHA